MTTVRPPLPLVLVVHLLSSSYVSPSVNRLLYQPVLSHTPPSQFKSDSTLLRQIEVGSRPTDGLDYESYIEPTKVRYFDNDTDNSITIRKNDEDAERSRRGQVTHSKKMQQLRPSHVKPYTLRDDPYYIGHPLDGAYLQPMDCGA